MDWGDGAGFINDSVAEDPQQVTSSVSVAGDDRNKLIAAVSVSQVAKLTRPNEGLIIHGKKIYHINIVGYVLEIVDVNQQKIHVLIDDHTGAGPLEVTHIIGDTGTPGEDPSLSMFEDHMADSSTNEARDIHSVRVGDYVRVVGVVKYSQDKANVVAYSLRIIDDPNEITMHIMEVIRDTLYYQKIQATGGVLPVSVKEDNRGAVQNTNQQQTSDNGGGFGVLSTREKHLLTFLKAKASPNGIHIDEITNNFKSMSKPDILKSLTLLTQEGLCWTGDDENMWCVD